MRHEFVGVHLDARGHPGQDLRADGWFVLGDPLGHQPLDPVDLVERVDDDPPDADGQGRRQLGVGLVVAVEHQPVGGDPGGQGHVELPAGGDVEAHALVVGQSGHGQAEEGLGGVGHAVAPRLDRPAAPFPQVDLVVDEQGGAEPVGQVDHVDTTDPESSVGSHGGGLRQQTRRDRVGGPGPGHGAGGTHGHMASGAATPSRPNPMARPTRGASTSQRRAWARPGSVSSASIGQSW